MTTRHYRGVLVLAVNAALLAGCSSTHPLPPPSAKWEPLRSTAVQPVFPSRPALPEVDQNLVEAYAHYAQGVIYDLDDQPDLAQAELSKAALADPSNTFLVLELSHRYLVAKQPEKALQILLRAAALPNATGELFARLAMVEAGLGKDQAALESSLTAIKRSPNSLEGYRTLYFIHMQKGRFKEAEKILDQAAKVPNTSPEFGIELVELYAALEHQAPSEKAAVHATALGALNRAAGENPASLPLRLKMADDYDLLGDSTNATRLYLQLLESFNDLPVLRANVHDKLAQIYLNSKDYARAQSQLEAIVEDNPTDANTYYLLGSLADEQKKFAEAAGYFQKTLLLSQEFEQAYYDLARVQIDLDQPKEALETLAKARKKFALGFVPEVLAALAYERQKDYTNAINRFTSAEVIAKATDPARLNGGFYFDQGAAFERAGNIDQAEKCFQKSLDLTPNAAEVLNYLGYMWAEHGMKLEKAHELIAKAVELEPKSAAYLDSLGWVLYKMNRPAEALPQLQKAIELSPEPDPTLYDHLGDIYASLKQTDKAREAWLKSLALDPNEDVRKKVGPDSGKPGT